MEEGERHAQGDGVCHRRGCGVSGGTSKGKVEGLICEAVEVQVSGSLKPAVEVCVIWSIHARLGNPVLSHQV
jgi:hypothetical protein